MEWTASVAISAERDRVWEILADVERWPTWTASMRSVEPLQAGFAVGARFRVRQPRLPVAVWTVTELVPNTAFTWETRSAGVRTEGRHELSVLRDGTTGCELTLRQTGPLAPIVGRFTRRLIERYVTMEATGLQRAAESAT